MFQQCQSGGSEASAGGGERMPRQADAMVRFDPAALVRGIVYHLVDEGIASEVTRDSITGTLTRLVGRNAAACVARERWEAMTNKDRLDWLLAESRTSTLMVVERTAALVPAKK